MKLKLDLFHVITYMDIRADGFGLLVWEWAYLYIFDSAYCKHHPVLYPMLQPAHKGTYMYIYEWYCMRLVII